MLLYVYVFALVLGGILLVASMVLGGEEGADGDVDADMDADLDADIDADGDIDQGQQLLHTAADTHGSPAGFFTTLLSLRFWTFFLAFFGASGLLFDGLDLVEGFMQPLLIATGVGFFTGYVTVTVIRTLSREGGGAVATSADYVGKSGRVLLPVGPETVGKVRLEVGGTTVDVLASSIDGLALEAGAEALVIQMDGATAIVSRLERTSEE